MKTLHFHFHNLYVKSEFQQNRASLWKALAPKLFEIQTWDRLRLKIFVKIFENISFEKNFYLFFVSVFSMKRKVRRFFLYAW